MFAPLLSELDNDTPTWLGFLEALEAEIKYDWED